MKELCEYSRQKKLARKHHHQEMIKIYGECKVWETRGINCSKNLLSLNNIKLRIIKYGDKRIYKQGDKNVR